MTVDINWSSLWEIAVLGSRCWQWQEMANLYKIWAPVVWWKSYNNFNHFKVIDFMQSLKNKSMLDQMYVDSILRSVFHKKWKYKTKSTKILPFFFRPAKPVVFHHICYWWNLNVVLESICKGNTLLSFITQVVRNSNNKQISHIMTSTMNN